MSLEVLIVWILDGGKAKAEGKVPPSRGFVGSFRVTVRGPAWSRQCTKRETLYRVYAATVSNRAGVQVWPHRLHVQLISG